MRIQLGASVKTADGHGAGTVERVVWDPERREIREFVLTTGGLLGHDVVVSRDVLEAARAEGDELRIGLTRAELLRLDRYDERAYAPPPFEWMAPAESNYAADAFLFPTVRAEPTVDRRGAAAADRRPRPLIRRGMSVRDASGEVIGRVDELRVDDMTGALRAIVLDGADEARREIAIDQLDVGTDEVQVIGDPVARRDG